jgi:hypothetical protein
MPTFAFYNFLTSKSKSRTQIPNKHSTNQNTVYCTFKNFKNSLALNSRVLMRLNAGEQKPHKNEEPLRSLQPKLS